MGKLSQTARKAAITLGRSNLTYVAPKALEAGMAEGAADDAVMAALQHIRPDTTDKVELALFADVRHSWQVGRMAAKFRRAGDNRPDADLLAYAQEARDGADSKGAGNLKEGQRRRTQPEQDAYNAAKTAWSGLLPRLGLKSIASNGGANNGNKPGTKGKAGNKTKAGQGAAKPEAATIELAKVAKFMPPERKELTLEKLAAWCQSNGANMVLKCEALNQKADKTGEPAATLAIINACAAFRDAINKAVADIG